MSPDRMTFDDLRRFAVTQTLFPKAPLPRALRSLGFVQADPIRAPARAQDLVLRHRVAGYRAGDLERRYAQLGVQEDFFVNYGFVTKELQALMHPRPEGTLHTGGGQPSPKEQRRRMQKLLAFARERGELHPREVDLRFAHGTVRNYWGGSSNATTQLLDAMHYRGLLRVQRREGGVRIYALHQHGPGPATPEERRSHLDALVAVLLRLYAPVPAKTFAWFVRRLGYAAPQWRGEITATLKRAREQLPHATIKGIEWYWPEDFEARERELDDEVRLLAPFDPIVQDRLRFEALWGWAYRFEAYTPVAKRKLGYYALPILWRGRVIGWGNVAVKDGALDVGLGYVASAPRDRAYARALDAELERMRAFLNLPPRATE
ncbi:MAG TPA: crosslink repair DNA glycosylase YcaQ family protein [Polyangiaceae bacterium]